MANTVTIVRQRAPHLVLTLEHTNIILMFSVKLNYPTCTIITHRWYFSTHFLMVQYLVLRALSVVKSQYVQFLGL